MKAFRTSLVATALLIAGVSASAQHHAPRPIKMVAYDAKDRKYYSVAWAKAHGMKDKGGDRLIVIPKSKLPRGAKLSHAMHGIEP